MARLQLPEMPMLAQHTFYAQEGAVLQMFGEASYDVFMGIASEFPFHSIVYTATHDFTIYVWNASGLEPEKPSDMYSVMRQLSLVRRCIYAPVLKAITELFTVQHLREAVNENREEDRLENAGYRHAIQMMLDAEFNRLAQCEDFAPYLEISPRMRVLEIHNLVHLLRRCKIFSELTGVEMVVPAEMRPREMHAYLVTQFPFAKSIVNDYLTRDLHAEPMWKQESVKRSQL